MSNSRHASGSRKQCQAPPTAQRPAAAGDCPSLHSQDLASPLFHLHTGPKQKWFSSSGVARGRRPQLKRRHSSAALPDQSRAEPVVALKLTFPLPPPSLLSAPSLPSPSQPPPPFPSPHLPTFISFFSMPYETPLLSFALSASSPEQGQIVLSQPAGPTAFVYTLTLLSQNQLRVFVGREGSEGTMEGALKSDAKGEMPRGVMKGLQVSTLSFGGRRCAGGWGGKGAR